MRQIQFSRFGGPEVLEVVEKQTPTPGGGEVLVRVRAVGVNFAETLMRQDRYAVTPDLPAIPGTEVAGTIERLGEGVVGLAVGARVAVPLFATGASVGGYTDHVVVEAGLVVPLPETLSFETAVALMIQGLTALYLSRQISPKGKTILISAAAGGVGSLLVQLAKRAGAKTIIATASSAKKLDFVRTLGADVGVDYTKPSWVDAVRAASRGAGPDIIYESAGGHVTKGCLDALALGGELVIYGALNIQGFEFGVPELIGIIFKNQSLTGFALASLLTPVGLKDCLAELFDLAVRGELQVTIGATYPLVRASDAHFALEGRGTMGKVVLVP
ncbi:NADPH:quinone oxidoreductase [Mesorhizobium loti]|nr:NADPH:quinone oxidoreductase [Mesorhizobium loti]